jgi:hypothetical protein
VAVAPTAVTGFPKSRLDREIVEQLYLASPWRRPTDTRGHAAEESLSSGDADRATGFRESGFERPGSRGS